LTWIYKSNESTEQLSHSFILSSDYLMSEDLSLKLV
jgi:hypothetical protein